MAWREQTSMTEREEFVALATSEAISMRALCDRFGVSRKTGYKWLARADSGGAGWSADHSRRPHRSPGRTAADVEARVVAARQAHPAWGGRKLHQWLRDQGVETVPAPSTITDILHRHDLIDPAHPSSQPIPQRFERPRPNDLWQLDFMGHLAMATDRVHPLTLIDDHSRYLLGVWACPHEQRELVQTHLTSAFQRYGLPLAILTDNGPPWGTSGAGGLTALEAWWIRLGIRVLHGQPYHPQTQGKIERLHRTLATEVTRTRRFADLAAAQSAFDHWRPVYNHQRPHEALDLQVPATRYQVSSSSFPTVLPPIDYGPEGPDCAIRLVRSQGAISFRNHSFFVGRGLIGQYVAVRPTTTDGRFAVFYCHQQVATIDLADHPKV
ncbi:MAG: IS481 family transposase [Thermomicrobiales bacterium]|nr:IS481 family transposase [Thermomicrobiales bacterium]